MTRRSALSQRILVLLILLLAFGLRTHRLDHQSLWWDEILTVARASMSLPELIENLFESRTQLPLYFLLIQAWGKIGRRVELPEECGTAQSLLL